MIDWELVSAKLAVILQQPLGHVQATPLGGGDINRAFRLDCGAARFFVKLNEAGREAMFVAEREGLEAIQRSRTIRVPEVYLSGSVGEHACIVMEYIDLDGPLDPDRLAQALAAMHGCRQQRFGFHTDNTIGSTAQINSWNTDWVEFWREHRLGFQLQLARRNGLDTLLIDRGLQLADSLGQFFTNYQPQPSLLHGDLWSGNQGADAAGNPVIYDPACYYGDHEADLAMMELFGSPGARFFDAYREHFPIDSGYSERRDLYNLYHLLNHANLFGGGYASQAQQVIERLLAQLH
ncbi:MAG TPA: fructosamine kinase family protein [Gammaproteobacteria bacterium]|nr:fructosamine kinase family protein [Gammaproteobacteria bacterium]